MNAVAVCSERLRRQGLVEPVTTADEYVQLFRRLQPVAPIAMSYPGSPPRLVHRVAFDDVEEANRLRAKRALVKGRFNSGRVAYVHADDLATYATAFRRPLTTLTDAQDTVLTAVRSLAPITPRQLKEETGILNKNLMPILHRLQEAFFVFEDQPDDNWERGWFDFGREWQDVDLEAESWEDAATEALRRFIGSQVFATIEGMRDWSGFGARALKTILERMEKTGEIAPASVEGLGDGWALSVDSDLPNVAPPRAAYMLDASDPLARSHTSDLKRRFAGTETLQYLLIDGEFKGVVAGHWRIGPHDVDDVIAELPEPERSAREAEILTAVSRVYHPPFSRIRRYCGRELA